METIDRPSMYPIRDPKVKQEICMNIGKIFQMEGELTYNPAPNPISLLRKHLTILTSQEYFILEKSDGNRYTMYFCFLPSYKRYVCVLINRSMEMFQIQVKAQKDLFKGSLFDAELVKDNKQFLKLLVFDVYEFKGKSCMNVELKKRYRMIKQCFPFERKKESEILHENHHVSYQPNEDSIIPFLFYAKQMYLSKDLVKVSMMNKNHASDGIIFMPRYEIVQPGTNMNIYKFKYKPSVDLYYSNRELWIHKGKSDKILFSDVYKKEVKCNDQPQCDNIVIEYEIFKQDKVLTLNFLRVRPDKQTSNNLQTVTNILQEIEDGLLLTEIQTLLLNQLDTTNKREI